MAVLVCPQRVHTHAPSFEIKRRIMVGPTSLRAALGGLAAIVSVDLLARLGRPSQTSADLTATSTTSSTSPPFISLVVPHLQPAAVAPAPSDNRKKSPKRRRRRSRRGQSWKSWLATAASWGRYILALSVAAAGGAVVGRLSREFCGRRSASADSSSRLEVRINKLALDGIDSADSESQDRTPPGDRSELVARARRVAASRRDRVLALGDEQRH